MNKKIFIAMAFAATMAACTEDFKDWAQPQQVPQPDIATFADGSVAAVGNISLNTMDESQTTVKVCQITAPTSTNAAYTPTYSITLGGSDAYSLDTEGCMKVDDLQSYLTSHFGSNPNVFRTIDAVVEMWIGDGASNVKTATSGTFQITASPKAPFIDVAYYLTGSINGWDNTDTTYKLTNDGSNPYDNPTFTCRIPAPEDGNDIEFKMTPESGLGGDWSMCLAGGDGTEGIFTFNNVGDNLKITAVEGAKFYDLKFNMLEQTWSYAAINFNPFVYFIGATDGWSQPDQKLALTNADGTYTGYIYVADPNGWGLEFKFQKIAGDWGDNSQLNSKNLTDITGDFTRGSDNIGASKGEGIYFVTYQMANNTLDGVKIENMNLVGSFNGWNQADDAQQMTWDAENYCYVKTGAGVNADGWKFTANNDWGINLGYGEGGSITDLAANGGNITEVGTTIKLYPTRKTSDKIYCTVE